MSDFHFFLGTLIFPEFTSFSFVVSLSKQCVRLELTLSLPGGTMDILFSSIKELIHVIWFCVE